MKITMLGTGNANVTKCYNTCFALSEQEQYFLVDAGGGNRILTILEEENIPLSSIHDVFVSHCHTDHVLGVIWIIRMVGQSMNKGQYEGNLNLYCHRELAQDLERICGMMLAKKVLRLFGDRIRFIILNDGDCRRILGDEIRFFDMGSVKMKQFGFVLTTKEGVKLACCGDETMNEKVIPLVKNSDWLMHEAFCLYAEKDIFKPYEKHHSTVKDACEMAETLGIRNLILYHTEDTHIETRKALYTAEGKSYFSGNLFVPDDRDVLEF